MGLARDTASLAGSVYAVDLAQPGLSGKLENIKAREGNPDVLIHLASCQPGQFSLGDFVSSNVLSTANLLDNIDVLNPKLFIYTSTISVYDKPPSNPVREDFAKSHRNPYVITKLAAESLVTCHTGAFKSIVLRLPSLYGHGQADSFVDGLASLARENKTIELYSRGERLRDALHVSDVVRAIQLCFKYEPQGKSACLNLGCGTPITARQYAEAVVESFGSSSPVVPVDKSSANDFDIYLDITKAKSEIGFEPTPLKESLEKYVREVRNQS